MKKVVLLYNPHSGRRRMNPSTDLDIGAQRGALIARRTEVLFGQAGVDVETHQLEEKGHAERLCQVKITIRHSQFFQSELNLKNVDVLCIIGGDGTFHECINGWMKRANVQERESIPLAMIPGGTGKSTPTICDKMIRELLHSGAARRGQS